MLWRIVTVGENGLGTGFAQSSGQESCYRNSGRNKRRRLDIIFSSLLYPNTIQKIEQRRQEVYINSLWVTSQNFGLPKIITAFFCETQIVFTHLTNSIKFSTGVSNCTWCVGAQIHPPPQPSVSFSHWYSLRISAGVPIGNVD